MTRARVAAPALLLALLAGCGGPQPPWAEPPAAALDLRSELSADEAALLAPLTLHLDLFRRADLAVEFAPQVADEDWQVEVEVGAEVPFGDGVWQRTTLRLLPVRTGSIVLAPFVARATDGSATASTPERTVEVRSVLGEHGAALEAPSGVLEPPRAWWPYVALGGGLLAALVTIFWFTRVRRRPAAVATSLPAHAKALRALARLRTAPRTTNAQIAAFYVDVSDVLRTYLEERFGLCAPERTTEEFLRDLEGGDVLARGHRGELERFLSQCDLVKFAAHVPTEADHLATFALAETFVERTRADRASAEVGS